MEISKLRVRKVCELAGMEYVGRGIVRFTKRKGRFRLDLDWNLLFAIISHAGIVPNIQSTDLSQEFINIEEILLSLNKGGRIPADF